MCWRYILQSARFRAVWPGSPRLATGSHLRKKKSSYVHLSRMVFQFGQCGHRGSLGPRSSAVSAAHHPELALPLLGRRSSSLPAHTQKSFMKSMFLESSWASSSVKPCSSSHVHQAMFIKPCSSCRWYYREDNYNYQDNYNCPENNSPPPPQK